MNENIQKINELLDDAKLLVMFSTGKDSIVMSDLLVKNFAGKMEFVFLYFVEGLEIKQRIIDYYEKLWNIKIHQVPHFSTLSLKTGKKYKMSDIEHGLRKQFDISYIAQGIRRDESLARRGMLKHLPYGIDERNKKVYPVADFSAKTITSYIKLNKLQLSPEYNDGWKHDISVPDANGLLYLKNNFNTDYQKIISEFPKLESAVFNVENAGGGLYNGR